MKNIESIGFFSPNLKLGGYEKVIINLANYFAEKGCKVDVICGKKEGELLAILSTKCNCTDLNTDFKTLIIKMTKYLQQNNDLEYLYVGFRLYTSACIIAKAISRSKVKIIFSQHGFESNRFLVNNRIIKGIIRKSNYKIAVTKVIADYEKKSLNLDSMSVIYNPVISDNLVRKELDNEWFFDKTPIIVTCGRISKIKHQEIAIKVLFEINKIQKVRLMIIGDGPERDKCQKLVEDLHLKDLVQFCGMVDDPISYMKKASLLLHLSEREGFCNTIVEALYSNIPVLVTDCGGPIEIIEGDKYGINLGRITDENFINNTAKKCLDVLNGSILFSNLVERGMEFTISNSANKLEELLLRGG